MGAANLTAAFDWLEFTVQDFLLHSLIVDVLRLSEEQFKPLTCGRFGYNAQWKWSEGNLFILFNTDKHDEPIEDDKMGLHVIITGTGCRRYEQTGGLYDLMLLVIGCIPKHKFTRIDLAIDDHGEDLLAYDRIHQAAIAGYFTSRWSRWDEVNSRSCTSNDFLGRTMYFGSQKSDIFVRIYDKRLERLANDKQLKHDEGPWTRLEVVYKKQRAQMLAEHLVYQADVGIALKQTLNNYIRFITPPKKQDTNKSRWQTVDWWLDFIGQVGTLKLTVQPLDRTIDQMTDWVDRQIAPTIAAIMTAYEGALSWLFTMVNQGQYRLKSKHKDAIAQFQN